MPKESRESLVKALHRRVFLPPLDLEKPSAVRDCATETELAELPLPVLTRLKARIEAGQAADYPYRQALDHHRCCDQEMYRIPPKQEWVCGNCGRVETSLVAG